MDFNDNILKKGEINMLVLFKNFFKFRFYE